MIKAMNGKVTHGIVSEMGCHRLKALLTGTWAKCIRELIRWGLT